MLLKDIFSICVVVTLKVSLTFILNLLKIFQMQIPLINRKGLLPGHENSLGEFKKIHNAFHAVILFHDTISKRCFIL